MAGSHQSGYGVRMVCRSRSSARKAEPSRRRSLAIESAKEVSCGIFETCVKTRFARDNAAARAGLRWITLGQRLPRHQCVAEIRTKAELVVCIRNRLGVPARQARRSIKNAAVYRVVVDQERVLQAICELALEPLDQPFHKSAAEGVIQEIDDPIRWSSDGRRLAHLNFDWRPARIPPGNQGRVAARKPREIRGNLDTDQAGE